MKTNKRSSTLYVSTSEKYDAKVRQFQTAKFLRDFWEVGPFRLNTAMLKKIPEPFDFQADKNIFADYLQPEGEYKYIRIGKHIFLFWVNTQKYNPIPDINPAWAQSIAILQDAIPQWSEILKVLAHIKFNLAVYDAIHAVRDMLPRMADSYGLCIGCDNNLRHLSTDYSTGSNWGSEIKFAVYSPVLATSQLPGLGSTVAASEMPLAPEELIQKYLLNCDNTRCRLSVLPAGILEDNTQGHWDLFWPEGKKPPEEKYAPLELDSAYVSRDPAGDIQTAAVTIDFGTSSTVIALRDKYGQIALQRIGLDQEDRDRVRPEQFENPTVLHFDNLASMLAAWQDLPCRPAIDWADVQCSHEARHNNGDVHNCLAGLKTWARGNPGDEPIPMADKHGNEIQIAIPPLAEEEAAEEGPASAFNPIELYAFFLGLHLNNQIVDGGRIFTEYYMTFPVKFEKATKRRILESFRAGLLRSLPASLIYGTDWDQASFVVEERANEPAAYAAAVLPLLDLNKATAIRGHQKPCAADDIVEDAEPVLLSPTQEGLAFGVFDFGGGTTDFAIGLYRLPTAEEEDEEGWERVVEILDTSGDRDLGGEHLLDELAFAVVRANKDKLLNPVIPFTRPPRAGHVTGGEELFAKSVIARENTAILRELLRPLWEKGELDNQGMTEQLEATFKTRDGEEARNVALNIDEDGLKELLRRRIKSGVDDFSAVFAQAFNLADKWPRAFHIILAGNSCKSPMVMEAFEAKASEILDKVPEKEDGDVIYIHPARKPDEADPERVTLKTGVAIGLLQTLDGEPCGIVTRHIQDSETPFPYYVGPLAQDRLDPVLQRNAPYGEWKNFSKVFRHGKTKYLYSLSPQAIEGNAVRGKNCVEGMIVWGPENAGKIIAVKPVNPNTVVFALRGADGKIEEQTAREVVLEK